jgi:hypothetical protein
MQRFLRWYALLLLGNFLLLQFPLLDIVPFVVVFILCPVMALVSISHVLFVGRGRSPAVFWAPLSAAVSVIALIYVAIARPLVPVFNIVWIFAALVLAPWIGERVKGFRTTAGWS